MDESRSPLNKGPPPHVFIYIVDPGRAFSPRYGAALILRLFVLSVPEPQGLSTLHNVTVTAGSMFSGAILPMGLDIPGGNYSE